MTIALLSLAMGCPAPEPDGPDAEGSEPDAGVTPPTPRERYTAERERV
ncbi:MAG: hypothetical protein GY822_01405 [Deltaproteobacteria bacterium]|nr:hypothetical protein [Deltaproteobacteria bacterium]